jgi:hypothetical protein
MPGNIRVDNQRIFKQRGKMEIKEYFDFRRKWFFLIPGKFGLMRCHWGGQRSAEIGLQNRPSEPVIT